MNYVKKKDSPERAALRRLQALFADRLTWVKRHYAAMGRRGPEVAIGDPNAVCFCLDGGLQRVIPDNRGSGNNAGLRRRVRKRLAQAIVRRCKRGGWDPDFLYRESSPAFVITAFNDAERVNFGDIQAVIASAIKAAA